MYMPPTNNSTMNDLLKKANPVSEVPSDKNDPFADVKAEMADRFALLPEELQKVIMGSNYQQQLFDIAKTHKMTFEELGTLELETTMVLLGMTRPENFRDEIQSELKKNDLETDTLVKDINEKVFAPVQGALERVYAAKKDPADYIQAEPAISEAPAMKMTPPPVAPKPFVMPTPAVPTPAPISTTTAAPVATISDILSADEKSVLEKTGVILNDTPVMPVAQVPSTSSVIAPPTISPERNEMLHDIEFPPKSNPSIMPPAMPKPVSPQPMSAPVAMPIMGMPTVSTSYSVPKPPAPTTSAAPASNTTPSTDPYREPIS